LLYKPHVTIYFPTVVYRPVILHMTCYSFIHQFISDSVICKDTINYTKLLLTMCCVLKKICHFIFYTLSSSGKITSLF